MEVFEAVRTALAIRNYKDTPVPPEVVRRIVEAGQLTGSAMNGQPWHFIVVDEKDTLNQLGAIARTGPYIAQAPLAIVVAVQLDNFSASEASRAVHVMILTAWSQGIGSNWVGFMGLDDVKPLLGVPKELDVIAVIPFGYPAKPAGKGKKNRKSLSEIAHRGRFGQPFK